MIIITGATGQLGRQVTERLLDRVPAGQIGVSVRDPEKARDLGERGVRVRRGDFADAGSLTHAFEEALKVLIVSVNSVTGKEAVRQNSTAIEAARAAGAQRVFYTSHVGSDPISAFPPHREHAATETVLRDSGVAFTSLRNGFYAQTLPILLGDAFETGELRVPEDGPVAWTTHADLAEATAAALADEGLAETVLYLTASEAVDMDGVAKIASEVTGRRIRRVVVSDAEYRDGLVGRGLPESAADSLLGIFVASRQGAFARVNPTLARLIARPPMSLRDVLEATA